MSLKIEELNESTTSIKGLICVQKTSQKGKNENVFILNEKKFGFYG